MTGKPTYEELEQRSRSLEQKQIQQQSLLESLEKIARMAHADHQALCDQVLLEILKITESKYAFYGFLNEDESVMTIYSWSRDALEACKVQDEPICYPIPKAGIWAEAVRQREPIIINDYNADHPGKKGLPEGHVKITRLLSVPIFIHGRIVAVAAGANKESAYVDDEVRQVEVFATTIQALLDNQKSKEALQKAQDELERLVEERTAELSKTNEQLKAEIGDRKLAEEALRESEAALKERIKELNCLYCISALLELPGISLDAIFKEAVMLIPPAWQLPDITAARIVWDGQSFQTENFRETPWMQSSKIIVHGKPVGQVEVCYLREQPAGNEGPFVIEERKLLNAIAERLGKIVERLRANEALRESEEKYRSLVDSTNDWVWACDIEGRQTFANKAVKTILGYDVHEIEGVLYENLIHPEDQRKTRQWFKRSIEKKKGWKTSVIRCRHKDGTLKFLESTAQPSFDAKGNLTGFIGLDRDVTERKRAEEALRESEEKYRSIMEAMDDEVYICSPDFRIAYINPAMKKRIGYDATGEPCHKVMHGLDEKCPWCIHGKVMKGETVKTEFVSPKDGKTFHVSSSPIFHTDGSISKLTVFRDVTETKKMIEQLQQSQKILSIGTLAGGIAHDFNNILFPIMGFAEMALDDAPENSPLRNKIKEIIQGTKRASDLVKQILAFSRQSGQELKPLKVQLIVKEVLKLIRSSIPTTIEIKQHISNNCGLVTADPTQIHQIAMNLTTNAYHAMEDKGGVLEVTLKEIELGIDDLTDPSMTPGVYACLSVADTGIGIDQITIDRVFEPYFTTKEIGKGTGLGLSVVHGIVKSYNGDIRVYSEPDKGTVFHVYLPVIKSQFETEKTEAVTPVPKGTERILLVDDEEPIVRMETEMLERLGYDVTERTSSVEALEAFRNAPNKFELVITDMTMPNMTGVQLSQKLLEIRPDIPIIICTGFSTKIDDEKAKEFGIRGFVMKPVVQSELAKKIREVLDQEEQQTKARILIIDDEVQTLNMLRQMLECEGYEVIDAPDGKEGLRLYRENPTDLIITDIIMPEKEGIETIVELRRDFPDVKIIAISGGGRESPDNFLLNISGKFGAQRTFAKPVEREELLKAIRELLK